MNSSFNLIIKDPKRKQRKVIKLLPNLCSDSCSNESVDPNSFTNNTEWLLVLKRVEEEFVLHGTEFQLSLNYGKTYIDSAPSTKLSELGIVNGDILTLNILPNGADEHSPIAAPTNRFSYPKSVEQTLIADSLPETSRDTAGSSTNMDVSPDNTSAVVVNQYLLNPMLLRDVTSSSLYPAEFHQLILENSTSNSCELLLLTLHTLLLEGGFTSLICKSAEASFLKQITRSPDVYQIQYCHKFYPDGKITVAFVKMDQKLAVHGIVQPSGNISMTLSITNYTNQSGLLGAKLSELSRNFKDLFVMPLVMTLREALGMDAYPPLLNLPHEVLMAILDKLDARSLCYLGQTCSQLSQVYKSNAIWKRLYLRFVGALGVASVDEEDFWYKKYKEEVLHKSRFSFNPSTCKSPMILIVLYLFLHLSNLAMLLIQCYSGLTTVLLRSYCCATQALLLHYSSPTAVLFKPYCCAT
ncbi:hypothetical protein EB796_021530 [Bugula neritina]|uniref:F-box domain-containing protein n=1 Tax=Bugula neritina TaxID=10212 RepID=A0A7J7J2X8_BUGNE|nr:hypothetical protein EB796_021530 [Bugula neritina]